MNYTCGSCKIQDCIKAKEERTHMPVNCPTREQDLIDAAMGEYLKPEVNKFYVAAGENSLEGKLKRWPRIMETVGLCKRMGYHHIGIACCIGFTAEADICARIFRREGFEVDTVMCCAGGINELEVGVPTEEKYWDGPNFCVGCNPIGQAKALEKAGTEFNVVLGLCVGHDSLFVKYSPVLSTVLTVKERKFPHNPEAGIYYAYGCMLPEKKKEQEPKEEK